MTTFLSRHGVVIGLALFVLAASWLFIQPEPHLARDIDLSVVPKEIGSYMGKDIVMEDVPVEEVLAPQALMFRDYYKGSQPPINLLLLYNSARRSGTFHDPHVCFPAQGFTLKDLGKRDIDLNGQIVRANLLEAEKNSQSQLVVYWLLSGNKVVLDNTSRQGPLMTALKSRLKRSVGVTSMVRVTMPVKDGIEPTYNRIVEFLSVTYPSISSVRVDIGQQAMPATMLKNRGSLGVGAMAVMLFLPLILTVFSLVVVWKVKKNSSEFK